MTQEKLVAIETNNNNNNNKTLKTRKPLSWRDRRRLDDITGDRMFQKFYLPLQFVVVVVVDIVVFENDVFNLLNNLFIIFSVTGTAQFDRH